MHSVVVSHLDLVVFHSLANHFFNNPRAIYGAPNKLGAVLRCMPSSFVLPRARLPERNVLNPKFAKIAMFSMGSALPGA